MSSLGLEARTCGNIPWYLELFIVLLTTLSVIPTILCTRQCIQRNSSKSGVMKTIWEVTRNRINGAWFISYAEWNAMSRDSHDYWYPDESLPVPILWGSAINHWFLYWIMFCCAGGQACFFARWLYLNPFEGVLLWIMSNQPLGINRECNDKYHTCISCWSTSTSVYCIWLFCILDWWRRTTTTCQWCSMTRWRHRTVLDIIKIVVDDSV